MVNNDIVAILPELILTVAALIGLLLGVFNEKRSMAIIQLVTFISLIVALGFLLKPTQSASSIFNNLLLINDFTQFSKCLILLAALAVVLMTKRQLQPDKLDRFEYLILILFSTVGMMLMVSANDLIVFFMGLELQSLSLYILVAFKRSDARAAEGAIKYLVLGTLATVFILYGSSLVYGLIQNIQFTAITQWLKHAHDGLIVIKVGVVMIMTGIAFKISLAPFHMWTPDVYEGGPTPVVAFLSSAPKLAGMAIFMRLVLVIFQPIFAVLEPLLITLALLSIAVGTFAALFQHNFKRLIAYSTISHMGYAMLGFCGGQFAGAQSLLIYISIYSVMIITLFACLLCLRHNNNVVENIADLTGLSNTKPLMAGTLTVVLFSLAGIPPLMGFFAKYGIFSALISFDYYGVAFIGLLLSVIGAAYYLRIVKIMYFDVSAEGSAAIRYDSAVPVETLSIVIFGFVIITGYIFESHWINDAADKAAAALYSR